MLASNGGNRQREGLVYRLLESSFAHAARLFRPAWEQVITPVVDYLHGRPDVDRRRIALAGVSFGGYLVPRAATREHRLAAIVADGGVHDAFVSWSESLPREMLEMLAAGRKDQFDGY